MRGARWSGLLAALAVVASAQLTCVSVQPFQGVVAEADGAGARIFGSFFELHFAADGLHLPDHLTLGGAELLAPATGCGDPGGAGLLISPAIRIASDTALGSGGSSAHVYLAGPAAAQVEIAWQLTYPCGGAQTTSGKSTFTAFPDGRIVRHDHDVRVATTAQALPAVGCGCGGPGPFVVQSYLAVARAAFDHVVEGGVVAPLPAAGAPPAARTATCLEATGQRLAVAWPGEVAAGGIVASDAAVTLGRPLARGPLDPLARYDATTALALDLGHASCPDLAARLDGAPSLFVDRDPGTAQVIGPDGYVIVVAKQGGPVVIGTRTGMPAGFAVSIGFDRPAGDIAITRTPATSGLSYFWQYDGLTDRFILWFRDALAPGETIQIVPPG